MPPMNLAVHRRVDSMAKITFTFYDDNENDAKYETHAPADDDALWSVFDAIDIVDMELNHGTIDAFGGDEGGIAFQSSEIPPSRIDKVLAEISKAFRNEGVALPAWVKSA